MTRRIGRDGKRYLARPLTAQERSLVVGRVHDLAHEGLTYRTIVERLHADDLPGSLGSVRRYLAEWRCEKCAPAHTLGGAA